MNSCSIYIITNNINDKVYIGQTWQTLQKRFWAHCEKHPFRSKIKNAIDKYGRESFSIQLLVSCDNQSTANALETFWINCYDSINTGYNIREGGSRGKMSEETKKKMSMKKKGIIPVVAMEAARLANKGNKNGVGNKNGTVFKGKTWKIVDGKRIWMEK